MCVRVCMYIYVGSRFPRERGGMYNDYTVLLTLFGIATWLNLCLESRTLDTSTCVSLQPNPLQLLARDLPPPPQWRNIVPLVIPVYRLLSLCMAFTSWLITPTIPYTFFPQLTVHSIENKNYRTGVGFDGLEAHWFLQIKPRNRNPY